MEIYITKLYDETFLVNSRFKFDTLEEALYLFPELKDAKIFG